MLPTIAGRDCIGCLPCAALLSNIAAATEMQFRCTRRGRGQRAGAIIAALLSTLILAVTAQPAPALSSGSVVINELMLASRALGKAGPGQPANATRIPAWIELRNTGAQNADLTGWSIKTYNSVIQMPRVLIPPGSLLLILDQGKESISVLPPAQLQTFLSNQPGHNTANITVALRAPLGLSGNVTRLGQVALVAADGTVVDSLGEVPDQRANTSWGFPRQSGSASPTRTYLATPTPGTSNSQQARIGPTVQAVTSSAPAPAAPGQPIPVTVTVAPHTAAISQVQVVYKINQGAEQKVAATPGANASDSAGAAATYTANIPASAFKPGDLVRWAALATDVAGISTRFPALTPPPTINGTAFPAVVPYAGGNVIAGVVDPDINNVTASTISVLEWFTPYPDQSQSSQGAPGSTLFFRGKLYDGVRIRRRGVTSMTWGKPKLKVDLPKGVDFVYDPNAPPVNEFGLNSFWYEVGERSNMKEALGLRLMRDAGVPTPTQFYVHVRLNGKFYGLFSFLELVDETYLKRHNIAVGGPLFKSNHGEFSNLRWDVFPPVMTGFDLFDLDYPRDGNMIPKGDPPPMYPTSQEWLVLQDLTRGLAGGGKVKRSAYVMENLDIPEVINMLAAQVVINNQDRCTKNWYLYFDPTTNRWMMLPWDLDGALGQDNGYGGLPGPQYCVLACEQWNSPLYCDSEHPQDLLSGMPGDLGTAALYASAGRPLATAAPAPIQALASQAAVTPATAVTTRTTLPTLVPAPASAPVAASPSSPPTPTSPSPPRSPQPSPSPSPSPTSGGGSSPSPPSPGSPSPSQSPSSSPSPSPDSSPTPSPSPSSSNPSPSPPSSPSPSPSPSSSSPSPLPSPSPGSPPMVTASQGRRRRRRQLLQLNNVLPTIIPVPPNGNMTAALLIVPRNATELTIVPSAFPTPRGWDNPDRDTTTTNSTTGPAGTYNHLVDAITDVPATRAMLMRRICTLAQVYLNPGGRLTQFANDYYRQIRSLAFRDQTQWSSGIDIDKGYLQIVSEYIPTRRYQLLELYGPNGSYSLVPSPQPPGSLAQLQLQPTTATDSGGSYFSVVQVTNPLDLALDASGSLIQDSNNTTLFTFKPGTVIPARTSLYVVPDVRTYTQQTTGQGLFVTGPLSVVRTAAGAAQPTLRVVEVPA